MFERFFGICLRKTSLQRVAPGRIESLKVQNFGVAEDRKNLTPLTVLLGGSGKSTVFDVLSVGVFRRRAWDRGRSKD